MMKSINNIAIVDQFNIKVNTCWMCKGPHKWYCVCSTCNELKPVCFKCDLIDNVNNNPQCIDCNLEEYRNSKK